MKKCIFILCYFGQYNNYIDLFFESCRLNINYDWLIITDANYSKKYPSNCKIIKMSFFDFKDLVQKNFDFKISLDQPYKICDYRPALGYVFENLISNYYYWGFCDCDLIFGNMDKLLTPILEKDYDKIFGLGHLSIFKNTYDNNRLFMQPVNNELFYKQAFTKKELFVFDEMSKFDKNIIRIFQEYNKKCYLEDISLNISNLYPFLSRSVLDYRSNKFNRNGLPMKVFFVNGNIIGYTITDTEINRNDYLYVHLQGRKIRSKYKYSKQFQILPDRIINIKTFPPTLEQLKNRKKCSYFRRIDIFTIKVKRKLKKIFSKVSKGNNL